ncbi:hypothetical protein CXG81DRAFT_10742, partial [Caulochytrium protostelioides]
MSRWSAWIARQATPRYQKLATVRQSLPVYGVRDAFYALVAQHRVVLVAGETGSGKSTQIPQFVLEQAIAAKAPVHIVCTQPRRISAVSIASRVSEELGELPHDLGSRRSWVGYQVRMENKTHRDTPLVFCTTGVLLRQLESDPSLRRTMHIVIDEVHERSIDSDFLLLQVAELALLRPDLTVILMSATADTKLFCNYFNRKGLGPVGVLKASGRTFPVQERYLEHAIEDSGYQLDEGSEYAWDDDDDVVMPELTGGDFSRRTRRSVALTNMSRVNLDLVVHLVQWLVNGGGGLLAQHPGSILVFLPGVFEIKRCVDLVTAMRTERPMVALPLHSMLSVDDQRKVFDPVPAGKQKIVFSTNIAETGVTIPDVTIVIDSAKAREMTFRPRQNITALTETFISRANCKQRRGRAGRVREGVCFHLVTHDFYQQLPEHRPPEILRLPLENLCLRIRIFLDISNQRQTSIAAFLNRAIATPPERNTKTAVATLCQVGALDDFENLTRLGALLAHLPLDVRLGKMLILGAKFRCLDPILTVVAALSLGKSVFAPTRDRDDADSSKSDTIISDTVFWRSRFLHSGSDLLSIANVYARYRQIWALHGKVSAARAWCQRNRLHFANLEMVRDTRSQLLGCLVDAGLVRMSPADGGAPRRRGGGGGSRSRSSDAVPAAYNANEPSAGPVLAASLYPNILVNN